MGGGEPYGPTTALHGQRGHGPEPTAQRLRQGQPASEEDADGGGAAPSPGAALTERL